MGVCVCVHTCILLSCFTGCFTARFFIRGSYQLRLASATLRNSSGHELFTIGRQTAIIQLCSKVMRDLLVLERS